LLRGLITGAFGLMVAFIGYNDVSGGERFTYGIEYLMGRSASRPALIVSLRREMINLYVKGGSVSNNPASVKDHQHDERPAGDLPPLADGDPRFADRHRWLARCRRGRRGRVIPLLQHDGGKRRRNRRRTVFGKGNIKGVIAPEAAINAKDCSALIPTLPSVFPARRDGGCSWHLDRARDAARPADAGGSSSRDLRIDLGVDRILRARLFCRSPPRAAAGAGDAARFTDSRSARLCVAFAGSYAIDMTIENVVITAIFGIIGYLMIRSIILG